MQKLLPLYECMFTEIKKNEKAIDNLIPYEKLLDSIFSDIAFFILTRSNRMPVCKCRAKCEFTLQCKLCKSDSKFSQCQKYHQLYSCCYPVQSAILYHRYNNSCEC